LRSTIGAALRFELQRRSCQIICSMNSTDLEISKVDSGMPLEDWPSVESRLSADQHAKRSLDVGCGPHKLEGSVGIDIRKLPGVDVVANLDRHPWPLPESHFKFIRCQHVIEHLSDLFGLAREMYRVSAANSVIEFKTPHYSSYASWGDPTHRWHFALGSIPQLFEMAVGPQAYRVRRLELKFTGSVLDFFGWLIYKLSKKTYEKHFAWIFPANEIICEIEILK